MLSQFGKSPASDDVVIREFWIDLNCFFYVFQSLFVLIIAKRCQCSKVQWIRIFGSLLNHFFNERNCFFVFFLRKELSGNLNKLFGSNNFDIDAPAINASLILSAGDLRATAWPFCVADSVLMTASFTSRLESEILIVIVEGADGNWVLNVAKCIQCFRWAFEHFWAWLIWVRKETKERKRNKSPLGKVLRHGS